MVQISEEKDENRKKILQKELSVLNTEEKIANGLLQKPEKGRAASR